MRWYEDLYVGEQAKKNRYAIIQKIRRGARCRHYVLTPSSNGRNLLDLYPVSVLSQPFYRECGLLIVGIAADYEDAVWLAARIVEETYRKTGGFDVNAYLSRNSLEPLENK